MKDPNEELTSVALKAWPGEVKLLRELFSMRPEKGDDEAKFLRAVDALARAKAAQLGMLRAMAKAASGEMNPRGDDGAERRRDELMAQVAKVMGEAT